MRRVRDVRIPATNKEEVMDATATILASIAPWTKACLDRDWDALLAMCTNDVVFAPPGEPMVSGNKIRPWLEAFPVMKVFNFNFDRVDVGGDLATAVGSGTWTLELNGRDVSASFKFADVFRRGSDGSWRYAHVIWNSDTPAA
jgi:ketosteroid isomerase-like protein